MKLERNLLLAIFLLAARCSRWWSPTSTCCTSASWCCSTRCSATSLNLVVGYVGEFSLGQTAFLGIGAYTAAILSHNFGCPMWLTIPLAGLRRGACSGWRSARSRCGCRARSS